MSTLERIERLLEEPIPQQAIYSREGGGGIMLSYVSGDYVIDALNHIFGGTSWDSRTIESRELHRYEDQGKHVVVWKASVELCVHPPGQAIECIRTGSAVGSGKARRFEDAAHNAVTEAETDALKRAARQLGGRLGQQLYRKHGNLGELPGKLTDPVEASDTMRMFIEGIEALETMDAMQALIAEAKANTQLTHDERIELRVRLQTKYQQLQRGA